MKKQTSLKSRQFDNILAEKTIRYLYKGLSTDSKSTFSELFAERCKIYNKIFTHLEDGSPTSEQDMIQIEIEIASKYIEITQNVDTMEKIVLYRDYLCNRGKEIQSIDTLEKACDDDINKIESIKAWFIEKGLCDPYTFIWKDKKSGYKTVLAGYLKDLRIRGYTNKLSDIEIHYINRN